MSLLLAQWFRSTELPSFNTEAIYWSKRSIVKDLGLKEACDDKRKAGISASHCMYVSPKSLSVSYSYEGITDCIVLSPFFLLTWTI